MSLVVLRNFPGRTVGRSGCWGGTMAASARRGGGFGDADEKFFYIRALSPKSLKKNELKKANLFGS
jgi:hypothetical protein